MLFSTLESVINFDVAYFHLHFSVSDSGKHDTAIAEEGVGLASELCFNIARKSRGGVQVAYSNVYELCFVRDGGVGFKGYTEFVFPVEVGPKLF